jgi:hypothetical protein
MISWSLFWDISCCVCRSFFSWSTSFLPFPLHKRKRVVIFPWKRRRTIGYSYIDGVEKIHTVLLLLLMRQDSICCCCRVRERREREKKENHFLLLFLPVNRKEKWKFPRLHFCCCCCLLFFWKRTVDRSTDSKAPGGWHGRGSLRKCIHVL